MILMIFFWILLRDLIKCFFFLFLDSTDSVNTHRFFEVSQQTDVFFCARQKRIDGGKEKRTTENHIVTMFVSFSRTLPRNSPSHPPHGSFFIRCQSKKHKKSFNICQTLSGFFSSSKLLHSTTNALFMHRMFIFFIFWME